MNQQKQKSLLLILALILFMQSCAQAKVDAPALTAASATVSPAPTRILPTQTRMIPTATQILPAATSAPRVTLRAVEGNLFIRRGPDMAYNRVGVLYKDTEAAVVAHDVLFKWAQVVIPNSTEKGWVSLLTQYSKLEGDLKTLPGFTPTDWPQPAYLRNCTHHQVFIEPGNIFLDSSYSVENEIWLYPGHYFVYDIDMPDNPVILEVDMREGATLEINEDGAGERRKCPK